MNVRGEEVEVRESMCVLIVICYCIHKFTLTTATNFISNTLQYNELTDMDSVGVM